MDHKRIIAVHHSCPVDIYFQSLYCCSPERCFIMFNFISACLDVLYVLVGSDPASFGLRSLHTLVGSLRVPVFSQKRHAGASHGNRDVALGVGVTAPDAGACASQDDRGHVDRSAAVLVALLPGRTGQASFA